MGQKGIPPALPPQLRAAIVANWEALDDQLIEPVTPGRVEQAIDDWEHTRAALKGGITDPQRLRLPKDELTAIVSGMCGDAHREWEQLGGTSAREGPQLRWWQSWFRRG